MSTFAISSPDNSRNSSVLSCTSLGTTLPSLSPNAALTSVVSTPRVGVEFKDRIFVGGFPPGTTDVELRNFFSKFGVVREAKIIRDHTGTSKGYGFITYETEEEARKVRESCGGFVNGGNDEELLDFKGRKLNVGPAIRKASNRSHNLDVIPQGAVVLAANGTPFVVQNGMTFCASPDSYAVAHPTIGSSFPLFLPQQFVLTAPPQYVMPSSLSMTQSLPQNTSATLAIQQDVCPNQHLNQPSHYSSPIHHTAFSTTSMGTPQTAGQQQQQTIVGVKTLDVSSSTIASRPPNVVHQSSASHYAATAVRSTSYACPYDTSFDNSLAIVGQQCHQQQQVQATHQQIQANHNQQQQYLLTPPPTPVNMQYKSHSPEPSATDIEQWFCEGNFDKLEKNFLDGKTDLIVQNSGKYMKTAHFLDNIRKSQVQTVKNMLIQRIIEIKLDDINEAIKDGNLRKIKSLIDRKKLVLARNREGYPALHLAVMNEQAHIVHYLLQTFPECINVTDKFGHRPAYYEEKPAGLQKFFVKQKPLGDDLSSDD